MTLADPALIAEDYDLASFATPLRRVLTPDGTTFGPETLIFIQMATAGVYREPHELAILAIRGAVPKMLVKMYAERMTGKTAAPKPKFRA